MVNTREDLSILPCSHWNTAEIPDLVAATDGPKPFHCHRQTDVLMPGMPVYCNDSHLMAIGPIFVSERVYLLG